MTTNFILPLLIKFDDIKNRAYGISQKLDLLSSDQKDSILQFTHDFIYINADTRTPGDSSYPAQLVFQLQVNVGAWYASFAIDNPAGTGSLSNVTIDSFSVSNTMAKNNAVSDDLLNANQYGSMVQWIMLQRPQALIMI